MTVPNFAGLAMNQIETEKIADAFDRNQDGMIDHSEIMAVLKGTKRTRPVITTKAAMTDAEKIEHEVGHLYLTLLQVVISSH